MSKIIDFFIFALCWVIVVYGLLSRWFDRFLSIIITFLGFVIVSLVLLTLAKRKRATTMKADELPIYLALMDRTKQTELFFSLVPENMRVSLKSPYFTYRDGESLVLVAVLYRFMNLTQEDIAAAYREATNQNANNIILLTRARDRKTLTLTALLPLRFSFPDRYSVHRALKRYNALPPKPTPPQRVKIKVDRTTLLEGIFSTHRIKYLLLVSFSLAILSLITPLKSYYLIMATVPLVVATIAIIIKLSNK